MSGKKPEEVKIKLLCPALGKMTEVVAWAEERIDLGLISRAFGLDPSTVRVNGHLISRGVDLIASSVTWKSLVSFFSSKGLPTGKHQGDAILVAGKKLCRVGHRRQHDLQDFQKGIGKMEEDGNAGNSKGIQLEAVNLLKNKKLKEDNSGEILNGQSCKRKQLWEDVNLFKKLKINEDKSGIRDDISGSIACSQFTCSYASKNLKRIREEEAMSANYKRIR